MHSLVRFANITAGGSFTTADLYGPALDALGTTRALRSQEPREKTRLRSSG
jgi:hypothetical protein